MSKILDVSDIKELWKSRPDWVDVVSEVLFYVFCVAVFLWLALSPTFAAVVVQQTEYGTSRAYGTANHKQGIGKGDDVSCVKTIKIKTDSNGSDIGIRLERESYGPQDSTYSGAFVSSMTYGTYSDGYLTVTFSSCYTLSSTYWYHFRVYDPNENATVYGVNSGITTDYRVYTTWGSSSWAYLSDIQSLYYVITDEGGELPSYSISNYTPEDSSNKYTLASWVFNATTSYLYTGDDWYTVTATYTGTATGTASTTTRGNTSGIQIAVGNTAQLGVGSYSFYGTIKDKDNLVVATSTTTSFTITSYIDLTTPTNGSNVNANEIPDWVGTATTSFAYTGLDRYTIRNYYSTSSSSYILYDATTTLGAAGGFSFSYDLEDIDDFYPALWYLRSNILDDDNNIVATSTVTSFTSNPVIAWIPQPDGVSYTQDGSDYYLDYDFSNWSFDVFASQFPYSGADDFYKIEVIYEESPLGSTASSTDTFYTKGGNHYQVYFSKSLSFKKGQRYEVYFNFYDKDNNLIYDIEDTPIYITIGGSPPEYDTPTGFRKDCRSYTDASLSEVLVGGFFCYAANFLYELWDFLVLPPDWVYDDFSAEVSSFFQVFPFSPFYTLYITAKTAGEGFSSASSTLTMTLPVFDIALDFNPSDGLEDFIGAEAKDLYFDAVIVLEWLLVAYVIVILIFSI